tara:strand:- start:3750 stop:5228 length:1479 start_codon:yes stop_codon:yes gene_type:complete
MASPQLMDVSHEKRSDSPAKNRSLIAEREVLGALLVDPTCFESVKNELLSTDFYFLSHQHLFESFCRVFEKAETLDVPLIVDDLKTRGLWEKAGGSDVLTRALDRVGSTRNLSHYVKVIQDKATSRRVKDAGQKIAELSDSPQGISAEELCQRAESELRRATETLKVSAPLSMSETIDEIYSIIRDEAARPNLLPTGVKKLDDITGGGIPSRLIVIGARPKHCKSAFCLHIAKNVLSKGGNVFISSLEMDRHEVAQRLLTMHAADIASEHLKDISVMDFSFSDVRQGVISSAHGRGLIDDVEPSMRRLSDGLFVDDRPAITARHIAVQAARMKSERGALDLVVVDHFHLLDHGPRSVEREDTAQSRSSAILRDLARELDCPVLLPVQLSRGCERRNGWDKIPKSSDTRECGGIEQDAYLWLGLCRPFRYGLKYPESQNGWPPPAPGSISHEDIPEEYLHVVIGENRGGPVGSFGLHFEGAKMRLSPWRGRGV